MLTSEDIRRALNSFTAEVHADNLEAGWWNDPQTGAAYEVESQVPLKLCLTHSEISEALEGFRKNLMDTHLTDRTMIEVELADAVIRIADLAGALGVSLGDVIQEKREYNARRTDHKLESRNGQNGKRF